MLIREAATANTPRASIVRPEFVAVHLPYEIFGIDEFGDVTTACSPHVAGRVWLRNWGHPCGTNIALLRHVHALLRKSPRSQVVALQTIRFMSMKRTFRMQVNNHLVRIGVLLPAERPKIAQSQIFPPYSIVCQQFDLCFQLCRHIECGNVPRRCNTKNELD